MRLVLDTNVLVSGILLPESVPGRLFETAELDGNLLFSESTFAELRAVLLRPKFDRYLDTSRRAKFLARCWNAAVLVDISHTVRACRDPNDDKFLEVALNGLEVALNGKADALVTGDADLLALDPFEGIPIITPVDYLAKVGG